MKYRDLIQFQPISSVIKIQEADETSKALELVASYVISDRMGSQIIDHILPHLQFNQIEDNRGLFIVGNYGTGKSHLMAVVSTIVENPKAVKLLTNRKVQDAMTAIAGKFQVIRMELGGVTIDLRDGVCREVEKGLKSLGLEYHFPPMNQITNNKESFTEMMGLFNERFPDQGLLLVIDELLDFLRSRNEQELVLDLGFLRELGELATATRLRVMAGIQEQLFGNPRFQFVADAIQRVQARFQEVRIVREDVAYVVSQRILLKNAEQKAWIRDYLQPYTPLYDNLAASVDRFVDLFPIHPDFFTKFEDITMGEKREILKTVTDEVRRILDKDIDEQTIELISYDAYWHYLDHNTALTADPQFDALKRRIHEITNRLHSGLPKADHKALADRIIPALAISRLTTGNMESPLGLTAQEMRDGLCLYTPLAIMEGQFLTMTVRAVCEEMTQVLSHQYLVHNRENDQYYIDMGVVVDYDALVKDKADALSEDRLNHYYFDILATILERKDPYVPNSKIWRYNVNWPTHNVERPGYLFLGTPNERPTAHPPREFYVYLLPPFSGNPFKDEGRDDEVFFRLEKMTPEFQDMLKTYAALKELVISTPKESAGSREYTQRINRLIPLVSQWISENFLTSFKVIHEHHTVSLTDLAKKLALPKDSAVGELVTKTSGYLLEPALERQNPGYPIFSAFTVPVTQVNLLQYAQDAIGWIAGRSTSNVATRLLSTLELLDGDKIRPTASPYARWIIGLMPSLFPAGSTAHVVNRSEMIEVQYTRNGVEDVAFTRQYHLEPALLMVVLTALVYSGHLIIVSENIKYDASKLMEWGKLPLAKQIQFNHIEPPKELPLAALVSLYELFHLSSALVHQDAQREDGVKRLAEKRQALGQEIIGWEEFIQGHKTLWGEPLWSTEEVTQWVESFHGLHQFIDDLEKYNTVGKLFAFPLSAAQVHEYETAIIRAREEFVPLAKNIETVQPILAYLEAASQVLPSDDPWQADAHAVKAHVVRDLRTPRDFLELQNALKHLKQQYQHTYMALHTRYRLSKKDDDRKNRLIQSPEWRALADLSLLSVLNKEEWVTLQNKLVASKMCTKLSLQTLETEVTCGACHFKPLEEASVPTVDMDWFENRVAALLAQWEKILQTSLNDPYCAAAIQYLDPAIRETVDNFLKTGRLHLPLSDGFVDGVKTVLGGIEAKEVTLASLQEQLGGGKPLRVQEAKERLSRVIDHLLAGSDNSDKVRIVFKLK